MENPIRVEKLPKKFEFNGSLVALLGAMVIVRQNRFNSCRYNLFKLPKGSSGSEEGDYVYYPRIRTNSRWR